MVRIVGMIVLALLLGSCSKDPNEQANKLFVEAQQQVQQSKSQEPEERLKTLRMASEKLNAIVTKYPGTNLAVQLISGQAVGEISIKNVQEAVADTSWSICKKDPQRECLVARALQIEEALKNQFERISPLAAIAAAEQRAGQDKEAAAYFEQALKIVQTIQNDDALARNLHVVAVAQVDAGLTDDALKTAGFAKGSNRWSLYYDVASAELKHGLFSDALQASQYIDESIQPARSSLLSDISCAEANAGKIPEATKLLESMQYTWMRVPGYVAIAQARLRAGQKTEAMDALKLALDITHNETSQIYKARHLENVASVQDTMNLPDDARRNFEESSQIIANEESKWSSETLAPELMVPRFVGVAKDQAKYGQIDGAKANFALAVKTAKAIQLDQIRSSSLLVISQAQLNVGMVDPALDTASMINSSSLKGLAFVDIVEIQAKSGNVADAVQLTEAIDDASARATALGKIALAMQH
jgi:tetratricopeptide (TPR) repeat protein